MSTLFYQYKKIEANRQFCYYKSAFLGWKRLFLTIIGQDFDMPKRKEQIINNLEKLLSGRLTQRQSATFTR